MKTIPLKKRREGFALAAAVLAMLVVGAIVTGGFYAASQEGQVAKATTAGDMSLYLAETGMNYMIGAVSASTLNSMSINSTWTWSSVNVQYGGTTVGTWQARISRLAGYMWVMRVTGTVTLSGPYSGAQRQVARVLKIRSADFDNNTAVQVYGDLTVGGSSDVSGSDWYSSSWSGCTTQSSTSAVLANPTTSVSTSGSGSISGSITRQPMDSTNFSVFGDMTYNDVASMANYTLDSSTGSLINPQPSYYAGGSCNTSPYTNWGAPTNSSDACATWFPIIHATNNLHISSSGSGQGILLVDGDLSVTGGFTFYGAVVVKGTISMTGTGGHINGTLITYGNGDLGSTSTTLGNSLVQYSSCAISRAVNGNQKLSRGYPISNRSWFDLSNVQNAY